MQATLQTTTKEIPHHHVSAFLKADLEEILKDFSEESELLTPRSSKGVKCNSLLF